jgi:flagellar motor protein MotB
MIIIYPMLVSQAVSENVIPGVAKTLESFIIVNAQNMIINNGELKRKSNMNFKLKGNKLFMKESIDDIADPGTKGKGQPDAEKEEKQSLQKQIQDLEDKLKQKNKRDKDWEDLQQQKDKLKQKQEEYEKQKARKATANVKVGDNKSMSLDPTYIVVEAEDKVGNKSNKFVGIKCMPMRVTSEEKLSRLILHDIQVKGIKAQMVALGRKATKRFYKFLSSWAKRIKVSIGTPSGDPRKDILLGMSGHSGDGFIVLSKNEVLDDVFLSSIGNINKLFKMGWGNIVIIDDVNRIAYFCMKQFKGVCTAMSFVMMYNNFGQLKVYETLEDAKKQSSSIFKIRRSATKVFSEWVVENKFLKYLCEDYNNE